MVRATLVLALAVLPAVALASDPPEETIRPAQPTEIDGKPPAPEVQVVTARQPVAVDAADATDELVAERLQAIVASIERAPF